LPGSSWMSAKCQKETFKSPRAPKENVETLPTDDPQQVAQQG
jgi:hypothetical protein